MIGADETAQWLRAFISLVKDLCPAPSVHVRQSPTTSQTPFLAIEGTSTHVVPVHTLTHTHVHVK